MREHIGLALKALLYRLNYCQQLRDLIISGVLSKILVLKDDCQNIFTQLDLAGGTSIKIQIWAFTYSR